MILNHQHSNNFFKKGTRNNENNRNILELTGLNSITGYQAFLNPKARTWKRWRCFLSISHNQICTLDVIMKIGKMQKSSLCCQKETAFNYTKITKQSEYFSTMLKYNKNASYGNLQVVSNDFRCGSRSVFPLFLPFQNLLCD